MPDLPCLLDCQQYPALALPRCDHLGYNSHTNQIFHGACQKPTSLIAERYEFFRELPFAGFTAGKKTDQRLSQESPMELSLENLELIPLLLNKIEELSKKLEMSNGKRWMSVAETAEYLGYSADRIYKMKGTCFTEGNHFHNKTGKIIFDRVAIDAWVVGKETDETHESQRQIVHRVLSSIQKAS